MKLFLASRAVHPLSLSSLERFVGGLRGKSVAYIPTAANGKDGYGSWKNGESWRIIQTLGFDLTLVELEEFRDAGAIGALKGKDLIWLAGGVCGYLMYWLRRCEIDTHIRSILSGETVYIGSSAGSMVAAPTLALSEWPLADAEVGASVIPGLGLVNFDILPHFQDGTASSIHQQYRGRKLYAVKDGEQIIVEDDRITVEGEERVFSGTR